MQVFNTQVLHTMILQHGLTKAELARRMGVSRACVSRILSGQRQPNAVFIANLKRVFPDCSLDAFFALDGNNEALSVQHP